jgi:hypothetical protein
MTDADALRDTLDRWKAGIDAHEPEWVSEVFTGDGWSIAYYQASKLD